VTIRKLAADRGAGREFREFGVSQLGNSGIAAKWTSVLNIAGCLISGKVK
jgi:hypothetical protein